MTEVTSSRFLRARSSRRHSRGSLQRVAEGVLVGLGELRLKALAEVLIAG
jgi:hypothetical protein